MNLKAPLIIFPVLHACARALARSRGSTVHELHCYTLHVCGSVYDVWFACVTPDDLLQKLPVK